MDFNKASSITTSQDIRMWLSNSRAYGVKLSYLQYVEICNTINNNNLSNDCKETLNIAILRNSTIDALLPVIFVECFHQRIHANFYMADYDSIATEILDISSGLYQFNPDIIIIFQWLDYIIPSFTNSFISTDKKIVLEQIEGMLLNQSIYCKTIRKFTNAPIIINNFPLRPYTTLGILDNLVEESMQKKLSEINAYITSIAGDVMDVYIADIMSIFANIGWRNSVDSRFSHMARAPITGEAIVSIGLLYQKFIRALRGYSKKCIILDCDNTLWGGIIGEDGITGIKIGSSYPGSCYKEFQEELCNLYKRGILLAICSKNNPDDVLKVLNNHDSMILKESNFVIMKVNWHNKADNIREIAKELNIGLDSMVFIDDNLFEIDLVRNQLPEVECIHLKGPLSHYRDALHEVGYFDSLSFSSEDKIRTEMYVANRERVELENNSGSLEDYFYNLQINASILEASLDDVQRISQLTQKTNQFNLTTRRYSEGQILEFMQNDKYIIYALKAKDKFSDLGLVGVAICLITDKSVEIDSLLMSCRALGRGLEDRFIAEVVNDNLFRNPNLPIRGRYIPTEKNKQCVDFYKRNLFVSKNNNVKLHLWEYADSEPIVKSPWITVNGANR
jgi:FkbH-like protein